MAEIDRREFLKLVGASAGAAAAAGCSEPVEKLIPYVVQPEEITPGLPVYYASTCRECPAGCGLLVKTREGRPIKLEGNPEHPVNRGALCARGQAAIGRTYHPDRHPGPLRRTGEGSFEAIGWDEAIALLAEQVKQAGSGTWFLSGDPGPTASRWIDRWLAAVGAGGRVVHEPFAPEALRQAASEVFGAAGEPRFDLTDADLVIDFGSDFLETGPSPVAHARQFAASRDVAEGEGRKARFVYVGPRLSMTASNADEWVAGKPGAAGALALAVARAAVDAGAGSAAVREALAGLLGNFAPERVAAQTGVEAETIQRLGRAVARARHAVALPPGPALTGRRARATAAAVLLLNAVSGSVGRGVRVSPAGAGRRASYRETLALIDAMKSGRVKLLLIGDGNPVYSLPTATGFAGALEKVPFVVSFASLADETSARADLILPDHTPLESWGDVVSAPGARSMVQPTLRPLHDTRALVDTLLDTGRALGPAVAARLPSGSFRTLLEQAWSDADWREAVARGGRFEPAPATETVSLAPGAGRIEVAEPLLEGEGDWTLLAVPSPWLYDGRGANLPWLQETPDPVTKIAWQSWAEVSHATAERLGLELGDVVAVETPTGTLEVSVYPRGGIRDDVVAIPIGQGHTVGYWASAAESGRPGEPRGANVLDVLPAATDESGGRAWLAARATLRKTGAHRRLALVQTSQNQRGRLLGEAVPLAALAAGDGHAAEHGGEHDESHGNGHGDAHHELLKPFDASKDADPDSSYRWGMAIDLDRCTGCSACVVACHVENNIPLVGERRSLEGRQMSWLRIERWIGEGSLKGGRTLPVAADPDEAPGVVDVRHAPQLCQHCGAAPCESVCPVLATYHNPEGMNAMIYNRCVGTRYCSNNCPYKVRRFNYYDYSRENWPGLLGLMLNPDVTVRVQGVMEKCTFCTQRVSAARHAATLEGRTIRDGEVTTACAQACPTQAIAFGNLRDEKSRVVEKSHAPARSYHALHELNTRPAITYLAQVKRGRVGEEG